MQLLNALAYAFARRGLFRCLLTRSPKRPPNACYLHAAKRHASRSCTKLASRVRLPCNCVLHVCFRALQNACIKRNTHWAAHGTSVSLRPAHCYSNAGDRMLPQCFGPCLTLPHASCCELRQAYDASSRHHASPAFASACYRASAKCCDLRCRSLAAGTCKKLLTLLACRHCLPLAYANYSALLPLLPPCSSLAFASGRYAPFALRSAFGRL